MDTVMMAVYRITERRDGCVYKSEKVCTIWIPLQTEQDKEHEIAKHHGGDFLVSATQCRFGGPKVSDIGERA